MFNGMNGLEILNSWPRYESGELVGFGDDVSRHGEDFEANVIALYRDGSFSLNFWAYSKDERVRHPAVLAADGEPLEVGQTVWDGKSGIEYEVVGIHTDEDTPVRVMRTDGSHLAKAAKPSSLTHQRPVLAADGKPLREGEHVWHVETGAELVVKELPKPGEYQAVVVFAPPASHLTSFDPDQLAHERPVLDADGVPIREGDTVYVLGFGEPLTVKGFTDDGRVLMSFHDESVCKKLIEQQSEAKS